MTRDVCQPSDLELAVDAMHAMGLLRVPREVRDAPPLPPPINLQRRVRALLQDGPQTGHALAAAVPCSLHSVTKTLSRLKQLGQVVALARPGQLKAYRLVTR